MRKHLIWVSAILAFALTSVAACGGPASTGSSGNQAASCVNASAAHHAYVVVEHSSSATLQKCVGFSGDSIDGQSLMDKSGIKYQAQDYGTLGKAVCQIDNEPAQFTKCLSDSGPWWLLFVETGGQWQSAQTGYATVAIHDKEALGWVYTAAASPSPPPLAKP